MPVTKEQQNRVNEILRAVADSNPYRTDQLNRRSEFYIYNQGFLASYLASLTLEDPWILKRFLKHCEDQR